MNETMRVWRDESLGRWHSNLTDVFDLICDKLRKQEPFSFARYGDGEWNAIYGKQGCNCDGHEYFENLGVNLKYAVESQCGINSIIMGLQPLTIASQRIVDIHKDFPNINWVDADSIHNASIDGRMDQLFDALKDRNVILVGPQHLRQIANWYMIFVKPVNCWLHYQTTLEDITSEINRTDKPVVLLCASMMSEVLIDEIHGCFDDATCIDIGSAFDPYVGVKSRRYHHKLTI